MRICATCPYGPYPNANSDFCDGCQSDPDVGTFGGYTDFSVVDDYGNPCHYYTEEEHDKFLELYDEE